MSEFPDHPRSRGVYILSLRILRYSSGSSPLARGLHVNSEKRERMVGIIPARAGFTHPGSR